MKIRKGFVSNSSSSSFVCDVCGEEVSGMDMCLSEAEMSQCVNGHTFCNDHKKEEPEIESESEDEDDDSYDVPANKCPCCTFQTVSNGDLISYLLKEKGTTREAVTKTLRETFPSYDTFTKYVKAK